MQPEPNRTLHTFTWRGITCRVTLTRNHRIDGWTLIILRVIAPEAAPLPFALDGHLQHGVEQSELDAAGGVEPFLSAWATRAADTAAYNNAVSKWRQADLFG